MAKRFLRLAVDPRATAWQVMLPAGLAFLITGGWTGLSAAAIVWALLLLSHRTVLRIAFVQRHSMVAVLVTIAVVAVANLSLNRSIVAWAADASVLLLATATWASIDDYRSALSAERALQVALAAERADGIARLQQQRDEVTGRVGAMLESTLSSVDDAMDASGSLRELAREHIRPLSHQLAEAIPPYSAQSPQPEREAPWRTVAMNVLEAPVVRPLLMAILVTTLFTLNTTVVVTTSPDGVTTGVEQSINTNGLAVSADDSTLWSVVNLLLVFAVTWAAGVIAVRLTRKPLRRLSLAGRIATAALTVLGIAVTVEVFIELAHRASGYALSVDSFGERLALTLPVFVVVFIVLLVRTVAELFASVQRGEQELSAQLAWESARAYETLVQERRFLATELHGPLQSMVAATAMGLEEARRRGDDPTTAWAKAQEQLTAAVNALADGPPQRRDLVAELNALTGTWAGLCDVQIEIEPPIADALANDWVSAGTVSDIVTEAVANAVMHGQASEVHVGIAKNDESTMRLLVTNDGHGLASDGDQGLGSRQLDEIAMSWSRAASVDGTRLDVVLPAPR